MPVMQDILFSHIKVDRPERPERSGMSFLGFEVLEFAVYLITQNPIIVAAGLLVTALSVGKIRQITGL